MRRGCIVIAVMTLASCSGSSTAPSAPSAPVPVTPPVVTPTPVPAPPPVVRGPQFSQIFWDMFVHNSFDAPANHVALQRLQAAPMLYLKTVDEAGRAIDAVTLQTVEDAMAGSAAAWGGGQFGLRGVERGTGSKEGLGGWVTVRWAATNTGNSCGRSTVGVDGGFMELNYLNAACGCNGSQMRPRTARHELGHAFGYWHTDSQSDLMSGVGVASCDQQLSGREIYHASIAYQTPVGTANALPISSARSTIID